MVTYIRSDLDFILAQIEIAEAHAAGADLFGPGGLIPSNNLSWGLRTVDGTYNNLIPGRTDWGSADQQFPELLDPVVRDGQPFDPDGPGGPAPAMPTSYAPSNDPNSIVVDSSLRTISNLIVDQTISNPAAVARFLETGLGIMVGDVLHYLNDNGSVGAAVLPGETLPIPNVAPDEGLSAEFNSWFTLFGQFFDHGLDLVDKGGSGTVFVPLQPDDPLYVEGSQTNFMVLTRATVSPGGDGEFGTADDVRPVNRTTSFVDQNQTYASHPAHQVFLREYALDGLGRPVATGELIQGSNGGMATWADVKAQALMLGIALTDADVTNVPLLATDQYGNFIRGANGFPQVVTTTGLVEGNPLAPVDPTAIGAIRTGHAFLADIAHDAAPGGGKMADSDSALGLDNGGDPAAAYDDELLDAHFIAGDGRANENIGLTAVHHVFHAEHNRLVQHTKDVVLADGDLAFLNEWLAVDVATFPDTAEEIGALQWNGERLFQAAKFGTEMQYQHLVFEEFARKLQPQIDVFVVPDGYDVSIDPSIVAEFAHVIYRFGHSMLTESIDRYDASFTDDHISLIQGFLNPVEFDGNGTIDAEIAAGAIIRGMTRQAGQEIDEFVTGALRNNLLGLPLDLATINLARGRDTGVPSLNEARREFFEATSGDVRLKPYESWVEFAQNVKNELSAINFIAAYGTHALITDESSVAGKRAAAMAIVMGTDQTFFDEALGADRTILAADAPDALDFLNSTGTHANGPGGVTTTGVDNIDLWIGGLAEKISPFGGMLGSTFNFVFETQMEKLQNGDRFYYLQRLDGLHLFGEMEANSFASMIMRNTNAKHLPGDVFSTPAYILEVDQSQQFTGLGGSGNADPTGASIFTPVVIRNNPSTPGTDTNYLRYTGGDHVVLGGTEGNDILIGGIGDDTLWGDGGNDRLEGGEGVDIINGGDGHDIITDLGGDDNIKGGDGNDAINGGAGLNLILGGAGNDFVVAGPDAGTEVFAGEGNDFVLGSKVVERILGNEGNDWIEVGTFDGAPGDNFDEIFARDEIDGHDIFLGDGGFDEFIGEGGDDVMVGSAGRGKMVGMSGFDWATYKDFLVGVDADLTRNVDFDEAPIPPPNAALDTFEAIEGLSGSSFNDILVGTDVTSATIGLEGFRGSVLDADGIALISGLQALLGAGVTSFDAGNIILGGDGSDIITGLGGDDIIDGDKWLNVRISVRANIDGTGAEIGSHNSMTTLVSQVFSGAINPGQLVAVREILTADGTGDIDVAQYSGARADYDFTRNANGSYTVVHARGTLTDGTDTLYNMELLRFTDQDVSITNVAASGAPTLSDLTPTETVALTASPVGIVDPNGLPAVFAWQWQVSANSGATWTNIAGATNASFTPVQAQVGQILRVVTTFTDNGGSVESLASVATGIVGDSITGGIGNTTLNGTAGDDILTDSNIILIGGNDTLNGGLGADIMSGGTGNDTYVVDNAGDVVNEAVGILGSAGTADVVQTSLTTYTLAANVENLTFIAAAVNSNFNWTGNGSANTITGGNGADTLNGAAGNDTLNGGNGNDNLIGGAGNDALVGGAGTDTAFFTGPVGNYSFSGNGTVTVTSLLGTDGNDTLTTTEQINFGGATLTIRSGTAAGTTINGNGGADLVLGFAGNDTLNGLASNDVLVGGTGRDTLNGGLGGDVFLFSSAAEAGNGNVANTGRDILADYSSAQGDKIDLSGIDAVTGGANNAFTFIGTAAFSGTGQLRFSQAGGNTIVEGNVSGTTAPEFQLQLTGLHTLLASDFIL